MHLYKGFPPPDSIVRDYLIRGAACFGSRDGYVRAVSFIAALFQRTAEEVKKMSRAMDGNISLASLALEFRKRMTEGQSVKQCNSFREEFYDDVVKRELVVLKFVLDVNVARSIV